MPPRTGPPVTVKHPYWSTQYSVLARQNGQQEFVWHGNRRSYRNVFLQFESTIQPTKKQKENNSKINQRSKRSTIQKPCVMLATESNPTIEPATMKTRENLQPDQQDLKNVGDVSQKLNTARNYQNKLFLLQILIKRTYNFVCSGITRIKL